jgi:peptide/nickel transport system permease protein
VIFRHLLPNAVIPLFGQFSIGCAYAIQTTAGLSFLGFGVKIPHPEWGSMITLGAPHIIFGHWWPAFFPGVAVFLAVLMLRQISERVRSNYANIQ